MRVEDLWLGALFRQLTKADNDLIVGHHLEANVCDILETSSPVTADQTGDARFDSSFDSSEISIAERMNS